VGQIATKEGFQLEAEAAELIAFLGDGAFRDAIGILQKVIISGVDKKIGAEEVERITGAPSLKLANELISAVLREELSTALSLLEKVVTSGLSVKVYGEMLIRNVRNGLLLKYAPMLGPSLLEEAGIDQGKFLSELAIYPKPNLLINFLKHLLVAHGDIGSAYLPQLPLELALINLLGERDITSVK
jgi:DNA polymerase-3 subunit gamma/tau